MRPVVRPTPARVLRPIALAAASLALLGPAGCASEDPMEAIRQLQEIGDFEGSLAPLRNLLAENPDDPEANYRYGQALSATQQPNLARWSLRKAMKDPDWLIPAGLVLAYGALAAHDFNEVDEIVARILEREPDNVPALLMRANAHAYWRKDPERALADANRVLELDPDSIEAYEPRILALDALGRYEEAAESLAEAGRELEARDAVPSVLAWHCATTAGFQKLDGKIEEAHVTWRACLEAHPADLEVVSGAMSFYDSQGEPRRSLEVARAALAAAPGNRLFRTALADRLRGAGQVAEAEALLRQATESPQPEVASAAWMDLSKLRQAMGEYGASADALERAIALAREAGFPSLELLFGYADVLVAAGRLERALEVADQISLPAYRHLIRARVLQERRDPAGALEEFDAGIRLWPDNPYARYYAALAAQELGDFDRALEEFRYSIRNSPGATDARTRAATMLLAQGRSRQAVELLRTGLGQQPPTKEGQLLLMRLAGLLTTQAALRSSIAGFERTHPAWAGEGRAEAAEGVARRAGPAVALRLLESLPEVDVSQPRHAAGLRARVRLAHEAGETAASRAALDAALAARPETSVLHEIRGLDLELSGAPPAEVRAAYERAVELDPRNARALAGLGRLVLPEDPEAALALFEQAAAADPSDPAPKLWACRALVASGRPEPAAERLDALLLVHPTAADAALERARLDLQRGIATPRTLERARRAVRFGGGVESLEVLSQVHEQRGETEPAARAAARAQAIREGAADAAAGSPEGPTGS